MYQYKLKSAVFQSKKYSFFHRKQKLNILLVLALTNTRVLIYQKNMNIKQEKALPYKENHSSSYF